jgi:hypothetical protein
MKNISFIIKALIAGAGVFFCQCSIGPIAGGNSSQTGNVGLVVTACSNTVSGITTPYAHVSVYDQNYRPYLTPSGFSDSIVADDSGRFAFSLSRDGYFNLFVNDISRGNEGFVQRIPVFADSFFTDTIDTMHQPGSIAGKAIDIAGIIYPLSYIFINGSPFYTVTKNNGDFLLGPLPEGTYETGLFAAFRTSDTANGFVQLTNIATDTSTVSVAPGTVSQWIW